MVALRRSYLSLIVIAKSENKLGKMLFSNDSLEKKIRKKTTKIDEKLRDYIPT